MKRKLAFLMFTILLILTFSACSKKSVIDNMTLDEVIAELNDQGLLEGEPSETFYVMISAVNGIKYLDSNFEFMNMNLIKKLKIQILNLMLLTVNMQ